MTLEPSPLLNPNPPIAPEGVPSQKKSNRKTWIILAVTILCLCSIVCLTLTATGVVKTLRERAPITSVLESFMTYMTSKDIDSAYALFSPRVQRQISRADVEKMTLGNNYVLFEGYQSLTLGNFNVSAAVNTNPDLPQGTVANADGTVTYQDGFTGHFTAVLEKVDGTWRLHIFNITVPPDKLK